MSDDTSGALTCPNCGTSSEDHAVVMATDDMGSCNACGAVWNESDKAVKRIRTLESDLKAACEEAKSFEDELARAHAECEDLEADNARLAAEVERWKSTAMMFDPEGDFSGLEYQELLEDRDALRSRLEAAEAKAQAIEEGSSKKLEEVGLTIVSLSTVSRWLAAEERVKELEAFINDPRTKVLKLTHQWDRESGKWIDPDQTQEEG